ncbi:hypothetical protein MMC22_011158 [Lobaria immixta]|nr:hypothetical protein [Lobaria immixta]
MNAARSNQQKLTSKLADNVTSKTAIKTKEARIDLHKDPNDPDSITAKVQANNQNIP